MEKIIATIYGIWYVRNLMVFQDNILPPQEISNIALSQLLEFQRLCLDNKPFARTCNTGKCSNKFTWSPPPLGALKINVDAHLSSDGRWFSGLILRRADGSAVGAATRCHEVSNDIVLGEALAINDVLDIVEKLGVTSVIIESDCQSLVNAISKRSDIRKRWGRVVNRCNSFLFRNPNSAISWVRRDGNRVAHQLAKWAEHEPNIDWSTTIPGCILPYIQKDVGLISFV
jgi:ribonuclease HI